MEACGEKILMTRVVHSVFPIEAYQSAVNPVYFPCRIAKAPTLNPPSKLKLTSRTTMEMLMNCMRVILRN